MNKLALGFFFTLALSFQQVTAQTHDVRSTSWGMTMGEVLDAEGRKPEKVEDGYSNDKILVYSLFIDDRSVDCSYHFLNGRLFKVTYRYKWGSWQRDQPQDFKSRYYSLSSLFSALQEKSYKLETGWHLLNEKYSERGKSLKNCLGEQYANRPFDNLDKVESCFNSSAGSGINSPLYAKINFENHKTMVEISFPLKNHEYKNQFIGWITFESKEQGSKVF